MKKRMPNEERSAELWDAYLRDNTDANRNALVEHYWPTVRRLIWRYIRKLPEYLQEDADQAARIGLMQAVPKFDPTRGVKFQSYCMRRVRGQIVDEQRNFDWVPRGARQRGEPIVETSSLFSQVHAEFERGPALLLHMQPQHDDPAAPFECEEFWRELLRGLNKTERLILLLYYREGKTMAEIARDLELSESRVSQVHTGIVLRLRSQRTTKPDVKEIDDAIEHTSKVLELLKRLRALVAPTNEAKKRGRPRKVA